LRDVFFLATFRCPAGYNMMLDRRLPEYLERAGSESIWRIYSWEPDAISIGKNQIAGNVLHLDRLDRKGLEVIRRPTGGRAIYHKNDICISSAGFSNSEREAFISAKTIYLEIVEVLKMFFENINIKTVLAKGARLPHEFRGGAGKLPCFLTATPYELTASGKKIAGVALFIGKDRYLMQSSVRIGKYDAEDFRYFKGLSGSGGLLENVTSVEEETKCRPGPEKYADALRKALADYMDGDVITIDAEDILG